MKIWVAEVDGNVDNIRVLTADTPASMFKQILAAMDDMFTSGAGTERVNEMYAEFGFDETTELSDVVKHLCLVHDNGAFNEDFALLIESLENVEDGVFVFSNFLNHTVDFIERGIPGNDCFVMFEDVILVMVRIS